jgi:CBS domain-containing membrane protein
MNPIDPSLIPPPIAIDSLESLPELVATPVPEPPPPSPPPPQPPVRPFNPLASLEQSPWRTRWRVALGASLGSAITALLAHWLAQKTTFIWGPTTAWLAGAMGASAVMIFAIPSSPAAQPRAIIGGHTVSAIVGVICARWVAPAVPIVELAAALSVAGAIVFMLLLRCLHPAAVGTALVMTVLGLSDWRNVMFPVFFSTVVLVLCGVIYHRLTRRIYPLGRMRELLSGLHCDDIKKHPLPTVSNRTAATQVWELLHKYDLQALPVVDAEGQIVGIVTHNDVMAHALRRFNARKRR